MADSKSLLAGLFGGAAIGSKLKQIVSNMGCGVVLLLLAFGIVVYSVNGIREESAIVGGLPLQAANAVKSDQRGLVKVYGNLNTETPLKLELITFDCAFGNCFNENVFEDLLYYEVIYERFEVVKTTKEKQEDGKTVEEITYSNEWVEKQRDTMWADNLKIGGLQINPDKVRLMATLEEKEVKDIFIENIGQVDTFGRPAPEEIGDTRARVSLLKRSNQEFTVVGEMRSGTIQNGDLFIITDKSDTQLIETLRSSETFLRWAMRIFAWLMLTLAFTFILSPILTFTDFIPLAGRAARAVAGFISAILALIIVLMTVFLLNYWFICFGLIVLLLMGLGMLVLVSQKAKDNLTTTTNNTTATM